MAYNVYRRQITQREANNCQPKYEKKRRGIIMIKMKESDTSKSIFERQFVSAFNQASGFHYLLSHKSSFMHIEAKKKESSANEN